MRESDRIGRAVGIGAVVLSFIAAGVIAISGFRAEAQSVPGQPMVALGTCQLASLASSTGLASCSGGIPTGATAVVLRAETQALRYRSDAGAPSSSAGIPMLVADPAIFYQGALANLRFIEQTSGGKLNVLFYRGP